MNRHRKGKTGPRINWHGLPLSQIPPAISRPLQRDLEAFELTGGYELAHSSIRHAQWAAPMQVTAPPSPDDKAGAPAPF